MLYDQFRELLSVDEFDSNSFFIKISLCGLMCLVRDCTGGNHPSQICGRRFAASNQLLNYVSTNGRLRLPVLGLNRDG